jgi:hypothetical protein
VGAGTTHTVTVGELQPATRVVQAQRRAARGLGAQHDDGHEQTVLDI